MTKTAFSLDLDFVVEDAPWPDGLEPMAATAIRLALAMSEQNQSGPAEVSVLLTNDAAQKELNRQWRGKDKSTNVLSFPGIEPFGDVEGLVGDISMAYETVLREAKDLEKSFDHHFIHLLVHGFLHCLGYDHEIETEALDMEGLETKILAELGIEDPYLGDLDVDETIQV